MTLLSILATFILCRPALSQRLSAVGLAPRDDLNQTFSLAQPSPTVTDPAVTAAYGTYSQECGPDLNSAVNAALQIYQSDIVMHPGVNISDTSFLAWAETGDPVWSQASAACDSAENNYEVALASATPAPSSAAPAPSSASPGASSVSPGASAIPAPLSAPPTSTGPSPSSVVQPPASPSPSKPGSAALHAPSWALALAALSVVALCMS
ncbi:hypothetical protein GGX14DRAFT_400289 [Mycena pura]|uniref:Infection structure specific protein n=1 Tax=Mycena pura TaxID=153505 RepID=A0AAD6Y4L4_9AGAR|nr:hypothetical protein GGX14DRAFT_400289 [Mycena pura]